MKAVNCLILLLALAYCVEGRERLGKIFKRQVRQREYKAIQNPQAGFVPQSVVRNSFAQSQLSAAAGQPSQINVQLVPEVARQNFQGQQAQYQQAPQAQQIPQAQYQQAPQAQQIPQAQYQQAPQAQQIPQAQYQQAPQAQQIPQAQYQQAPQAQQIPQAQYQQAPQAQQISQAQYQQAPQAQQIPQAQYQQAPQAQQIPQAQYQQAPQAPQIPQAQYQQAPKPAAQPEFAQATNSNQYNPLSQRQQYLTTPSGAQAYQFADVTNNLILRLISNASEIRENIVDGFSCIGRNYGYYADITNECQIFHICYPLRAVYNGDPQVPDATYQYSFICPKYTAFDQASMTCGWTYELESCASSEQMYIMNEEFFKTTTPAPTAPLGNSFPVVIGSYQPPRN